MKKVVGLNLNWEAMGGEPILRINLTCSGWTLGGAEVLAFAILDEVGMARRELARREIW